MFIVIQMEIEVRYLSIIKLEEKVDLIREHEVKPTFEEGTTYVILDQHTNHAEASDPEYFHKNQLKPCKNGVWFK